MRYRLSTLVLLVIIFALIAGLIVQSRRANRREAELLSKVQSLQRIKQTFDEVALNRLRIEREKNAALRAQVDHLERQAEAREWVAEKSLGKPEKARLDAARKDR